MKTNILITTLLYHFISHAFDQISSLAQNTFLNHSWVVIHRYMNIQNTLLYDIWPIEGDTRAVNSDIELHQTCQGDLGQVVNTIATHSPTILLGTPVHLPRLTQQVTIGRTLPPVFNCAVSVSLCPLLPQIFVLS